MTIVYIKTLKKANLFCKIFNKFTIRDIENKKMIYLYINKKSKRRKIEKLINKLCKYLYNNNITTCVLDKELMTNETVKNELYYNNINILDGKKLDRFLLCNLIQKIYSLKNKQIETGEITLLINENDEINAENIKRIAEKVKRLNIVTNNIKIFNRMDIVIFNFYRIYFLNIIWRIYFINIDIFSFFIYEEYAIQIYQ